jgi:ZIP family zinc transporter
MKLAIALTALTFVSTLAGGFFALRFRDRAHLLLGFMAGFLLGVVAFDIFPEIINQVTHNGLDAHEIMIALVGAFLAFHVAEKLILIHHSHEHEYAEHHHPHVGVLTALALAGHSFMDGAGIGMGFQVSRSIGLMVAAAVISHDFTDGMNTVSIMLNHKNSKSRTIGYLVLDAVAPLLGLAGATLFHLPARALGIYLGVFAGFLLYIGAADILPEAHNHHSSHWTVAMTVAGAAVAYVVTHAL